jgi:hypothetical protein
MTSAKVNPLKKTEVNLNNIQNSQSVPYIPVRSLHYKDQPVTLTKELRSVHSSDYVFWLDIIIIIII